jgi:hypothetical protein
LFAITVVSVRDVGPRVAVALELHFADDFANRDQWYADYYGGTDLFPLQRTYVTTGATLEPGESAPCAQAAATNWIEYRADRSGALHLAADGDTFDAFVAVYTWDMSGDFLPSPPGAKLQPVACAAEGTANAGLSFAITRDTQYLIQIGGIAGAGDSGNISVTASCACAPPNDDFYYPFGMGINGYRPEAAHHANTALATLQPNEARPCGNIDRTVWYDVYTDSPTLVALDTAGSDFDTVIAVYNLGTYPDGSPSYEIGDLELIACEDDGASPASVTVPAPQYGVHMVQIGGASGASGHLQVTARCVPTCPPYNDSVANAEWWEPPAASCCLPTAGATVEDGEPRPCANIGATVWYRVTARGDTTLIIDSADSDFDTVLAVYESKGISPPGSLDLISCHASSAAGRARLAFDATANTTYFLQAGGRSGATGALAFSIDCTPLPCPPFHDTIQNPAYFDRPYGEPYEDISDARGATVEDNEPLDCGNMGGTTWWVVEMYGGRTAIPFVFDTVNSTLDTAVSVYEVPLYFSIPQARPFDDLDRITCDPGGAGVRVRTGFTAVAGKRYYVQVGGRNGAAGDQHVTISCEGGCPPENDNVALAWYASIGYQQATDTRAATTEPGESLPCGTMGKTVWYRLDPFALGDYRITTEGSDFATAISVYTIKGFSPPGGLDQVACVASDELTFSVQPGIGYLIQIGGVAGVGGMLQTRVDCVRGCEVTSPPGGISGPPNGGGVIGPDTGSGGYLPGARSP